MAWRFWQALPRELVATLLVHERANTVQRKCARCGPVSKFCQGKKPLIKQWPRHSGFAAMRTSNQGDRGESSNSAAHKTWDVEITRFLATKNQRGEWTWTQFMALGVGIGDRFSIQLVKIHRKTSHGLLKHQFHNLQGIQSDENGISYWISRDFCCALMGFKWDYNYSKY